MPFNTFRPGELEARAFGTLDERLERLAQSMQGIGVQATREQLCGTSALVSVTGTLDAATERQRPWRDVAVDLILVAESWPDKSLARHVLAWAKSIH